MCLTVSAEGEQIGMRHTNHMHMPTPPCVLSLQTLNY